MIGPFLREIAAKHTLSAAAGMAYGLLNGCFITLSEDADARRISIYVGPQEQPAPGCTLSQTVSCANQICHTISAASGQQNVYALRVGTEDQPALVLNHAGSVVTVLFPTEADADAGITRFIDELLPQIAPLTRPFHCILCCSDAAGAAVPVRLSADTVVPMHAPCHRKVLGYSAPAPEERAAQTRAVLLAVAGALLGALAWALLSPLGPLAWISGVLMGLLPTLAYDLLKGKAGKPRIMTILVCAAAAVLLGSIGAALFTAHGAWMQEHTLMQANDIGYRAFAWASMCSPASAAFPVLLKSLIAGFIFAAIGCIGCFRRTPADPNTPAANAEKPRRLRGKF